MNPISVVIPAYNEENAIGGVVRRIREVLGNASYEIIVVNDGSTDTTREKAEAAGARVISNPLNMGYGFSLKRGFREARHECVVITDADGTYPAEKIPELVEMFDKGFDMVVGKREGREYWSSWVKGCARVCFKWMSEYVVGQKIPDINSGFRAIRRSLMLPILPDLSNTFSFSTSSTLIFMLKKYFVTYIPIEYHKRTGKSKVKIIRDALIATQIMVEIIARYNPMKLFLLLAVAPFLFALVFIMLGLAVHPIFTILAVPAIIATIMFFGLGCFASIFRER